MRVSVKDASGGDDAMTTVTVTAACVRGRERCVALCINDVREWERKREDLVRKRERSAEPGFTRSKRAAAVAVAVEDESPRKDVNVTKRKRRGT